MQVFGGFSAEFFEAYHAILPKQPGFERRQKLYALYNYLHQLNLFGDPVVRDTCMQLMQDLAGHTGETQLDQADVSRGAIELDQADASPTRTPFFG